MMELIRITEQNGKQAVSARELHAFLESKQDFSNWIKNRIEKYGFIENVDFQSFNKIIEREVGATNRIEYALSIDCAKEISMVEGNEKGKQARRYFIDCEKRLKNPAQKLSRLDLAKMVIEAEEENQRLQIANAKLQNRSDVYDKVFGAEKYLSGSQVCKVLELGYGNKTLYKKLREMGIFFKSKNEPMQQYATKKWVMLKEKWIEGKEQPVLTPYFSQAFLPYLSLKLGVVENNLQKISIR